MDLGKLLRISQKQKMGKQGICIRTVCNNLWSGGGDRLRDLTSGGRKHPGTLFCRVAVATILEYVTGVLMEAIFHTNWWDYSDKKFNFQGKICLGSSVAWGFFTLILFYIFQPFVGNLVEMVPRKTGIVLVYVWLAGYTVDFAFSAAAAFDLRNKMKKPGCCLGRIPGEFAGYQTV